MIDLRSDTLTTPDEGMRSAMANAQVGDDVYAEDPTANELQERVAAMFGMEAALFVPSGTQGNQICIALHVATGEEVIAEQNAHIFHYENAATSVIARGQINGLASDAGEVPIDDIRAAIRPSAYYYPRTALIAVENTHNRHGGTVLSLSYLRSLREAADEAGLPVHCDGARIWNAMAATGVSASDYGACFDSMSVCLSKGLGAPIGSLIISSRERLQQAWRWRKMLGGGMRQIGILAAAGLYALDNTLPSIGDDHKKAKTFASMIAEHDGVSIDMNRVQTNIVMFNVTMPDKEFADAVAERGVRVAPIKPGTMRAVFYHQVSADDVATAAAAITDVLNQRTK